MPDLRRLLHRIRQATAFVGLLVIPGTVLGVVGTDAVGSPSTVAGAATATVQAVPGAAEQLVPLPALPPVDNPALVGCDAQLLQRLVASDPASSQWIMVVSPADPSPSGTLAIATAVDGLWKCSIPTTVAQLGRAGIRPLLQRRSGDGTTPAGIFPLGVVQSPQGPISFFGNSADPGALGPYRRIQHGDCYGANPNTPGYGHWRIDATHCKGDDELLEVDVQAYEHAVLIGANTEPNVSGDAPGEIAYASAIFLHRTTYTAANAPKPTSGCVSLAHADLVSAMRVIDPAKLAQFAIGTRAQLMATPAMRALPVRSI